MLHSVNVVTQPHCIHVETALRQCGQLRWTHLNYSMSGLPKFDLAVYLFHPYHVHIVPYIVHPFHVFIICLLFWRIIEQSQQYLL
jgi:hypothetical protein